MYIYCVQQNKICNYKTSQLQENLTIKHVLVWVDLAVTARGTLAAIND